MNLNLISKLHNSTKEPSDNENEITGKPKK